MSFSHTFTDIIQLSQKLKTHLETQTPPITINEEILGVFFDTNFKSSGAGSSDESTKRSAWINFITNAFGTPINKIVSADKIPEAAHFISSMSTLFSSLAATEQRQLSELIANICGKTGIFEYTAAIHICDSFILALIKPPTAADYLIKPIPTAALNTIMSLSTWDASTPIAAVDTDGVAESKDDPELDEIDVDAGIPEEPMAIFNNANFFAALIEALCFRLANLAANKSSTIEAELTFFTTKSSEAPTFTTATLSKITSTLLAYNPYEHGPLPKYLERAYGVETHGNIIELLNAIEPICSRIPLDDFAQKLSLNTPLEIFLALSPYLQDAATTSDLPPLSFISPTASRGSTRSTRGTLELVPLINAYTPPESDALTEKAYLQLLRIISDPKKWYQALAHHPKLYEKCSEFDLKAIGSYLHQAMIQARNTTDIQAIPAVPGLIPYYYLVRLCNQLHDLAKKENPIILKIKNIVDTLSLATGETHRIENFKLFLKALAPLLFPSTLPITPEQRNLYLFLISPDKKRDILGTGASNTLILDRLASTHPQLIAFVLYEILKSFILASDLPTIADIETEFFTSQTIPKSVFTTQPTSIAAALYKTSEKEHGGIQLRGTHSPQIPAIIPPSVEQLHEIFNLFNAIVAKEEITLATTNQIYKEYRDAPTHFGKFFPTLSATDKDKIFQAWLAFMESHLPLILQIYKERNSTSDAIDSTNDDTRLKGLKGSIALLKRKSTYVSVREAAILSSLSLTATLTLVIIRLLVNPNGDTQKIQALNNLNNALLGLTGALLSLAIARQSWPKLQALESSAQLNGTHAPSGRRFFSKLIIPSLLLMIISNAIGFGWLLTRYTDEKKNGANPSTIATTAYAGIGVTLFSYLVNGFAIGSILAALFFYYKNRNIPHAETTEGMEGPLLAKEAIVIRAGGFVKRKPLGATAEATAAQLPPTEADRVEAARPDTPATPPLPFRHQVVGLARMSTREGFHPRASEVMLAVPLDSRSDLNLGPPANPGLTKSAPALKPEAEEPDFLDAPDPSDVTTTEAAPGILATLWYNLCGCCSRPTRERATSHPRASSPVDMGMGAGAGAGRDRYDSRVEY